MITIAISDQEIDHDSRGNRGAPPPERTPGHATGCAAYTEPPTAP